MTQLPEDRDWERLVERVDLDVRADELAAAERAMGELPAAQVAALSSEWIEATVAKATADAGSGKDPVVTAPPAVRPVLGGGWWDGAKRFAAAVLAFVGAHSVASAATVTVAVGAVVAVGIWAAGRDSDRTMDCEMAVQIMVSAASPLDAREAAMLDLTNRVVITLKLLRTEAGAGDATASSAQWAPAFAVLQQLVQSNTAVIDLVPERMDFDHQLRLARMGNPQALRALAEQAAYAFTLIRAEAHAELSEQRKRALATILRFAGN